MVGIPFQNHMLATERQKVSGPFCDPRPRHRGAGLAVADALLAAATNHWPSLIFSITPHLEVSIGTSKKALTHGLAELGTLRLASVRRAQVVAVPTAPAQQHLSRSSCTWALYHMLEICRLNRE